MAKTFRQMVSEARDLVKVISPQEAKPNIDRGGAMLIDVREAWEIALHGTIPGARNITRGELEIKADTELPRRDPALADRGQKILLTCGAGGKSTLCAKALGEMGFTDV
jgi:rhodanese-related sulfurtransferase